MSEGSPQLSSAQRKLLRGQAQRLEPHLHIGKQGLTENVIQFLDELFKRHQLVKIRFEGMDRERQKELVGDIEAALSCAEVGQLGHTASFYRPSA